MKCLSPTSRRLPRFCTASSILSAKLKDTCTLRNHSTVNDIAYISRQTAELHSNLSTKLRLFLFVNFSRRMKSTLHSTARESRGLHEAWIQYAGAVRRQERYRVVNLHCAFRTRFRPLENIMEEKKKRCLQLEQPCT